MSEQNEILTAKNHTIEKSSVTDVPAEFMLPVGDERLVIGAKPHTESEEKPDSGLEVISLADYPRDAGDNIRYNGITINGTIRALIVDPSVAPDLRNNTGLKGLRAGEVVSSAKLAARFGKEAGFNIGLDKEGKLMIENINPDVKTDVLVIKPIAEGDVDNQAAESARKLMDINTEVVVDSPEAEEELHEEAAEDMGEIATENLVEIEEPEALETVEKKAEVSEIAEQLTLAKAEYDQRINNVLDGIKSEARASLSRVGQDASEAGNGMRSSLRQAGDTADTMRRIASRIESESDMGYAKRALNDVSNELHSAYARMNASTERGNDAMSSLNRSKNVLDESIGELIHTDKNFEQHVAELVAKDENPDAVEKPVFGTKDEVLQLRKSKDELDEVATALRTGAKLSGDYTVVLRRALGTIDSMIQEASYGRIDTDNLRYIARTVGNLADDRSALSRYAAVEEPVGKIIQKVSDLSRH